MRVYRMILAAVLVILVVALFAAPPQVAAAELDPLLRLLVRRSVITLEEAYAIQKEYDQEQEEQQARIVKEVKKAAPAATPSDVETMPQEKKKWYDRIKFKGDLRLRYELFDWDGHYDDGKRDRFRYRLRVGAEAKILEPLKVGFELRSGNPDNPVSDNQSLDGGFNKNKISIAQAYVKYKPNDLFRLTAGKFVPKKLWTVTDLQWDDDVTVEGMMQEFDWRPGGAVKHVDLNFYQFVLEESGSGSDAYLFGGQIAPTFKLNDKNALTVGLGYETISHPEKVIALTTSGKLLTEPGGFVTNLVDPATLLPVSDFRVANAFVQWKNTTSKRWPWKLALFYYKNFGVKDEVGAVYNFVDDEIVATANAEDNDTAFFARVQVGDYKEPWHWAFRLTRYDSEPDAMFYAYVQSDTKRGTNADGWRLDVRVGMPAKNYINLTWYRTDWLLGEDTTMDRFQLDYIFKF